MHDPRAGCIYADLDEAGCLLLALFTACATRMSEMSEMKMVAAMLSLTRAVTVPAAPRINCERLFIGPLYRLHVYVCFVDVMMNSEDWVLGFAGTTVSFLPMAEPFSFWFDRRSQVKTSLMYGY